MFVDALQDAMHKKYDLMTRQKESNQDNQPPSKKLNPSLSMDKFKELKISPRLKKSVKLQRQRKR
jgi:hypothetical protein